MNFGHLVGEHHFENQIGAWLHYALSSAPIILSLAVIALIFFVTTHHKIAHEKIRKDR